MKTITFTAVMAVLVAIPFILRKKRSQLVPFEPENDCSARTDEALRYAIDEFLT